MIESLHRQPATDEGTAFLGDLCKLPFKTEYRSLKEDPAQQFYRACLLNSTGYKRAVGYFRSSIYLVIGTSVVEFARRGGKINLICSPELHPDDIDGIAAGYARRSVMIEKRLIAEIDKLLSDTATSYQTQVLATLVSVGALDVKLALRADKKGLYHEKIGIFSDGMGNLVSFKGSANETWSGWHQHGNFESIEVFCSWRGGLEAARVQNHLRHFDSLWSGTDPDVEVFDFPNEALNHLKRAALRGLEAVEDVETYAGAPRRVPLPHQSAALEAWAANGCRGIFEHATGSGKTFTAILAIRQHTGNGLPVIVLVPSRLLLEQWANEIRHEIPNAVLLLAGGGHDTWKASQRLAAMTSSNRDLGGRIVLATMPTAASGQFKNSISIGSHLFIVADEVHQIGSPENSQFLQVDAGSRLGLSATPTRFGDPVGTQEILRYFGGVIPPSITLGDAIRAGRLVPYEYYSHPVNLTAVEAADWKILTREISLEYARQTKDRDGNRPTSDRAKMLLIKRARIAKKATKKIDMASEIVGKEFQEGQHWLIYCEDAGQLTEVMGLGRLQGRGLRPIEYHSSMAGDREATMAWFRTFGGPLVSIRCLDEGVDIPAVSHALILASSQNPRQFIQRRGRVLRTAPGKTFAVIHDVLVVPVHVDDEPEQVSLLKSELLRAIEFANNALNKMAAAELRSIAIDLGFASELLTDVGVEENVDA